MGYAIEIFHEWYGVSLPEWLRAFDCRGEPFECKAWENVTLIGSERAEADLGLKGPGWEEHYAASPMSCRTYIDARTASFNELARQVRDMVNEVERYKKDWEEAALHPSKNGGSAFYLPVAVYMANFGWGILCDRRKERVRAFRS